MTQSFTRIHFDSSHGVATITLNRPEKRNALDDSTIQDLKDALERVATDVLVRVVVLRAAGTDFCAGADLSALQKIAEGTVLENRDDARSMMELFLKMRRLPKPIVAAVHGRALAGGCGLATACDLVVASRSAQFGYPEVKIGFVPAMVMAMLRRSVSEKVAFELIARGEAITATRALEVGLVNLVVEDESFDADVATYIAGLAKASASAMALSKYLLYQIDGMTFDAAISAGADLNAVARLTEDCKRGIARFLKKD